LIRELADAGEVQSITCDSSRLPHLRDMDPETSYFGWSVTLRTDRSDDDLRKIFDFIADESEISISLIDEIQVRFDAGPSIDTPPTPVESRNTDKGAQSPEASKNARSVAAQTSTAGTDTHTLRVSTEKVDKLINLVGELVINQSMLNEVVQDFSMADLPRLMEAVEANERASRELQERVMGIRMLPIKHAFGRFPRLVRDMAGVIGKKIDLRMSGEETELDKTIIEAIGDPLTHLIRNSIDHGLESPSERHAVGKPETGVVSLNAFHEGGSIVIEVDDDGRGLNRDRILAKARERGLIADNDVPSDDAIYNIIFQPGFSTVTKVTDLSGRGVGMDIVRKAVQSMGGSVSLTSTPGKGTQFRIRLPLTMAILEGLSLGVGDETYIVPLTSIVESIQPKSSDVRHLANRAEVVMVRESVLPILRLYEAFQIAPRVTDPAQGLLVIVENDGRKAGLLADEIIGQSQVVIKSLEANYHKVNGIAGATIMGNGRVGLILDIPSLLREADSLGAAPIKEAA
jgi:two-component system chemotaxis sensor kinase CheA